MKRRGRVFFYQSSDSDDENQFSRKAKKERMKNLKPINPIARCILQGVLDEGSTLSKLNGISHVLQMIWK